MAGIRNPGGSAPSPRPSLPSQPQVASVETSSGVTAQRSTGGLSLRSVTSMFRPATAPQVEDTPVVTAQASSRPQINAAPGLGGGSAVVTDRAAQIIVPVAPETSSLRSGAAPQAPSMPVEQSVADLGSGPALAGESADEPIEPFVTAALGDEEPEMPRVDATPAPEIAECSATLLASAKLGEMLALTLTSECRPNSIVTLRYSGLSFTDVTDEAGVLQVDVPAFDENTRISAEFLDGTEAEADITVRGIDRIARVGIAWEGEMDLDLHAFEFTAGEGTEGHIWQGNERSYRESRRGGGGYMTRMGLPGARQVEVYTLPVSRRTQRGVVDTQVRFGADVTECDDRIEVLSIYNNQALRSDRRTISIDTAGCGANAQSVSFDSAVRSILVAER
ncbi:hypothetical protein [Roseobacter sp. HKCCA0434]|uniref:hypothetical protein n=1 Tax=Roseobacter sp. HKCCA0434 TaxID=3079297 RepID=UPI002905F348|nr:hypothetical protein [Roseobacter sp. HKCCA0434]